MWPKLCYYQREIKNEVMLTNCRLKMHHKQWRQNRRGGRCPRWQRSLDTTLLLIFFSKCLTALWHLSWKFSRLSWNLKPDCHEISINIALCYMNLQGKSMFVVLQNRIIFCNQMLPQFYVLQETKGNSCNHMYPAGIPLNLQCLLRTGCFWTRGYKRC